MAASVPCCGCCTADVVHILTPQGRTGFHAALFVSQTLEVLIKPQSWFTDDALREEVHYDTPEGEAVADIYRLAGGMPRAAVLLSMGANENERDDPDIVNLGQALARAGYVVMYHWSPQIGLNANIDPNEPENLVWAFQHLEERDYVDGDRVGLGGFCVGASLALVAAADPKISDRVHFVNAFGPYFDAESLLLQAVSRSVAYEGESSPWEPHAFTFRVMANELIRTLGTLLTPTRWRGTTSRTRRQPRSSWQRCPRQEGPSPVCWMGWRLRKPRCSTRHFLPAFAGTWPGSRPPITWTGFVRVPW